MLTLVYLHTTIMFDFRKLDIHTLVYLRCKSVSPSGAKHIACNEHYQACKFRKIQQEWFLFRIEGDCSKYNLRWPEN